MPYELPRIVRREPVTPILAQIEDNVKFSSDRKGAAEVVDSGGGGV